MAKSFDARPQYCAIEIHQQARATIAMHLDRATDDGMSERIVLVHGIPGASVPRYLGVP